jgi:hypothetical protein
MPLPVGDSSARNVGIELAPCLCEKQIGADQFALRNVDTWPFCFFAQRLRSATAQQGRWL